MRSGSWRRRRGRSENRLPPQSARGLKSPAKMPSPLKRTEGLLPLRGQCHRLSALRQTQGGALLRSAQDGWSRYGERTRLLDPRRNDIRTMSHALPKCVGLEFYGAFRMTEPRAIVEPSAALVSTNWMMTQSVMPAMLRLKSCVKVPPVPPEGLTVNEDWLTTVPSIR